MNGSRYKNISCDYIIFGMAKHIAEILVSAYKL